MQGQGREGWVLVLLLVFVFLYLYLYLFVHMCASVWYSGGGYQGATSPGPGGVGQLISLCLCYCLCLCFCICFCICVQVYDMVVVAIKEQQGQGREGSVIGGTTKQRPRKTTWCNQPGTWGSALWLSGCPCCKHLRHLQSSVVFTSSGKVAMWPSLWFLRTVFPFLHDRLIGLCIIKTALQICAFTKVFISGMHVQSKKYFNYFNIPRI